MLIKRRPQKWVECPVLMMFEETKQSRKSDRNTDPHQRSFGWWEILIKCVAEKDFFLLGPTNKKTGQLAMDMVTHFQKYNM